MLPREGDILIITDGAFGAPPPEFVESLAEARDDPGLKLVAVVIRGHPGQAGFADKVVLVSDLYKDREVLAEAPGCFVQSAGFTALFGRPRPAPKRSGSVAPCSERAVATSCLPSDVAHMDIYRQVYERLDGPQGRAPGAAHGDHAAAELFLHRWHALPDPGLRAGIFETSALLSEAGIPDDDPRCESSGN
jgi:hypothetical protein